MQKCHSIMINWYFEYQLTGIHIVACIISIYDDSWYFIGKEGFIYPLYMS